MNEPDSSFCEVDGTPLSGLTIPATMPPSAPPAGRTVGLLVMPDQSEIELPQTSRVFGRKDLLKYLPENTKDSHLLTLVSRAHFTIMQEGDAFYLQDGGPNPLDPQAWKPSVNLTSINGIILQPATKQKLNNNDVIDVSQLGLNLIFKTR